MSSTQVSLENTSDTIDIIEFLNNKIINLTNEFELLKNEIKTLKLFQQKFEKYENTLNGIVNLQKSFNKIGNRVEANEKTQDLIQFAIDDCNNSIDKNKRNIEKHDHKIHKQNQQIKTVSDVTQTISKSVEELNNSNEKIEENQKQIANVISNFCDLPAIVFALYDFIKYKILNPIEKERVYEWTNMKIGDIIYYSLFDKCFQNEDNIFDILSERSNVLFLFEDIYGWKFGYYHSSPIKQMTDQMNNWIPTDENSFLFSLKSISEIEPQQFHLKEFGYGIKFSKQEDFSYIALAGGSILILLENNSNTVYFDYNNELIDYDECPSMQNVLFYGDKFKYRRMVIFQLISPNYSNNLCENECCFEERQNKRKLKKTKIQQTNIFPREQQTEINSIESLTGLQLKEIIFNWNLDEMNMNRETFIDFINNKDHLIFVIEDENENVFGSYLQNKILFDEKLLKTTNKLNKIDKNAYLFSLKSNDSIPPKTTFPINRKRFKDYSLNIYENDVEEFFSFGKDIVIFKQQYCEKSFVQQQTFNYENFQNQENVLLGESQSNHFIPKRITVYQMKESNENIENMINITHEEKEQIEEWTRMECSHIIFDSDIDDWDHQTSVFDLKVFNRNNLIFLIEDTQHNKFGGYVSATIDKYSTFKTSAGKQTIHYIKDEKSFLFSLKSNGRLNNPEKYEIKPEKAEKAFRIFSPKEFNRQLFEFGSGDLKIFSYSKCFESSIGNQQTFFFPNDNNNSVLYENQQFTPKCITIIQMKPKIDE